METQAILERYPQDRRCSGLMKFFLEQRVYDAPWLAGLCMGRAKVLTATPDGESSVLLFSLGNGLLLRSGWALPIIRK